MRAKRATAFQSGVRHHTPLGVAIPGDEPGPSRSRNSVHLEGDKFRFALTAHGAIMQPVRNAADLGMHFVRGSASELSELVLLPESLIIWKVGIPVAGSPFCNRRRACARGIWLGVSNITTKGMEWSTI